MSLARNLANLTNGDDAPVYACRAWINFNGYVTSSPASFTGIRYESGEDVSASRNVSSIEHKGTGDYLINFANSLPDANYAISVSASSHGGTSPPSYFNNRVDSQQSGGFGYGSWLTTDMLYVTNTSFRFQTGYPANTTIYDNTIICVAIFR